MSEKLLDAAEAGIRLKGYHAVSFRDLANELGIKSSSVHYYFQQKEDLGVALVKRYSERFFQALDTATEKTQEPDARIAAICSVYRDALRESDRICLCGILGAESCGLPPAVSEAVAAFLNANIRWVVRSLPESLSSQERQCKAFHIVSTLQGAMILAGSLGKLKIFDNAVRDLLASI